MVKTLWIFPIVLLGIELLISSSVFAFVFTGQSWQVPNPMGEDWRVCSTRMSSGATQRTKDGAFEWNYSEFNFSFGSDACLSGGVYPSFNGVNQIDFGGGLGPNVLAETTTWFNPSTNAIAECDMRISDSFNWHTGTGPPGPSQFDWWSVATHEHGHCLHLGHEDTIIPKPVMASGQAPGEVLRNITEDDIAGRNFIYGPPSGGQCNGFCGGQAPIGCWCDNQCDGFGDCCPDVCADCPNLNLCTGGGRCDGFCGGQARTGCWCDDQCAMFNDCCPEVCDDCPNLRFCPKLGGFCAGNCGGQAPQGCFCDNLCMFFGDCCPDVCEDCPGLSFCL
jgi:hypothetical protein